MSLPAGGTYHRKELGILAKIGIIARPRWQKHAEFPPLPCTHSELSTIIARGGEDCAVWATGRLGDTFMEQRIRLITAAAVMLLGLGLALFFRRPAAENDVPIPMQSGPLVLHQQPDLRSITVTESPAAVGQPRPGVPGAPATPPEPRPSPTIVTPAEQAAPPPEMPKINPAGGQAVSTRWGSSLREMLPETASAPPVHKIIDGDSLALLAERYLGSASRAMEIYEANRNVLTRPEILPIGAELKIPRADQAVARSGDVARP